MPRSGHSVADGELEAVASGPREGRRGVHGSAALSGSDADRAASSREDSSEAAVRLPDVVMSPSEWDRPGAAQH